MAEYTNTFSERERELANKLHAASIRVLRRVRGTDASSGLSPARLSALSVLVFGGPQKLGYLAKAEGVKPPTMTRLIQAMERDGLVTRIPDLSDRRITYITATDKGVKLMEQARSRRIDGMAELLSPLDAGQRAKLEEAIEILEIVLASKES